MIVPILRSIQKVVLLEFQNDNSFSQDLNHSPCCFGDDAPFFLSTRALKDEAYVEFRGYISLIKPI